MLEEEAYDYVDIPAISTNDAIAWEPIVPTPPLLPAVATLSATTSNIIQQQPLATPIMTLEQEVESNPSSSSCLPSLELHIPKARKPCMVFHHRLSDTLLRPLLAFAKLFAECCAQEFQLHWERFLAMHAELVSQEKQRVLAQGFEGDFIHKLYRTARYYLRHKIPSSSTRHGGTLTIDISPEPRKYLFAQRDLTSRMASHIRQHAFTPSFSPAWGFDHFCETERALVQSQLDRFVLEEQMTAEQAQWKLKKSYKNKFAAMNLSGQLVPPLHRSISSLPVVAME